MSTVRINSYIVSILIISNVLLLINLFYRNYYAESPARSKQRSIVSSKKEHSSGEPAPVVGENPYYETLKNLTFGNAERKTFAETVELMYYDMAKPLPVDSVNKIECILLKNATPPYHVCLHNDNVDVYLSKHLRTAFVWEPHIQDLIKSFFDEYPDAFYFDLGMNIGTHALYAANLNTNIEVIAVEPFPKNVIRAHKAARLNKVEDRIKVIMAAVSDKRGRVTFHEKGGNIAGNIMIYKGSHTETMKKGFTTSAILFDDLLPFLPGKKALLKMDIEGQECHAFANADKIFTEIDIPVVTMEILYSKLENPFCFEMMLSFLSSRNYKAFYFPYKSNSENDNKTKPLEESKWRHWHGRDVYFKKMPK